LLDQLSTLLSDPSWFPAAIDTNANTMNFVQIDRDALSREAFLDQRMAGSVTAQQKASLTEVVARISGQQPETPVFVFHTSFCCSTLMVRALDVPGKALALKEPDVLMGLANALRVDDQVRQSGSHAEALVNTVFGLLARRFDDGEHILVKPTNAANNLLGHAIRSGARIVLLYGDLRSFLISVLKKGEPCKSFVRKQYNIFALDPDGLAAIPQRQAVAFTDLQAAALVWRHQMELFQRTLATAPGNQVVSLDFKHLLKAPAPILSAVSQHLELQHKDSAIKTIAEGPIFDRNSKFADQAFNAGQRDEESSRIEEQDGETLDLIEHWAAQTSLGQALRMPLSRPLEV